jgi:hypothetical protein
MRPTIGLTITDPLRHLGAFGRLDEAALLLDGLPARSHDLEDPVQRPKAGIAGPYPEEMETVLRSHDFLPRGHARTRGRERREIEAIEPAHHGTDLVLLLVEQSGAGAGFGRRRIEGQAEISPDCTSLMLPIPPARGWAVMEEPSGSCCWTISDIPAA